MWQHLFYKARLKWQVKKNRANWKKSINEAKVRPSKKKEEEEEEKEEQEDKKKTTKEAEEEKNNNNNNKTKVAASSAHRNQTSVYIQSPAFHQQLRTYSQTKVFLIGIG